MLLLLFASLLPNDISIHDTVELAEINHVYKRGGQLSFRQLILWDTYPQIPGLHVVDWRYLERNSQWPARHRGGRWVSRWYDSQAKSMRNITATSTKVSHTYFDAEVRDRQEFPVQLRRKLTH